MLCGLPEHAVRSDPVSERSKSLFVSNIMNISIYRKIDQFKKNSVLFSIAVPHSGAKMVASLLRETTKLRRKHYEVR